ncbi:MAG: DUF5925 domain-containing protein, partial [Actinomycetota bacterium]|nr:DUF5925 domain-containing protein [Actinomycetota bacterium]
MDNTTLPPIVVALDDTDDLADAIDALLLGPFVVGRQPAARWVRLERVTADAALLPHGVAPIRVVAGSGRRAVLAEGAGWTLRSVRWNDACAVVTVVAESEELAASVLADAVEGATVARPDGGRTMPVAFWHRTCNGRARRASRDIAALA